jgi:thymidine kinase
MPEFLETVVTGKLELIVGPMRSNKTAELLRRIETRRQYAKQYVLLLKPSEDTKAAAGVVESRNRNGCGKMEAVEFCSTDPWSVLPILAETERQIGKRIECVAIDEGQFVQDLFHFTRRLLETGHDVMVSGLELDFRGMPFGEMMDLSWLVRTYSGSVTELVAYCACGAKAFYPQRFIDGKPANYNSPIIMAGDNYEPRCAEHFILPGRPH